MLLLALSLAHAICERPVAPAALARTMADAESAYLALDLDRFRVGFFEARDAIPCLTGPLGVESAVAWHRLLALQSVTGDDWEAVTSAFRAALASDPHWEPSESFAPTGNPIRARFDAARLAGPGATRPWKPAGGGWLYVDGSIASAIPTERPYLIQVLGKSGALAHSEAVATGAAPHFEVARDGPPPAVVWSAVGAGVGAGGAYAVALVLRSEFDNPETDYQQLDGLESGTNTAVVVAGGLGAVALGLGLSAVVVRW